MTTALLILVGGRPIPNVLTVIHEKPEIIVAICSEESIKEEWLQLKPAISKLLPTATIIETEAVNAFDIDSIARICERELLNFPDADWILNVTTGTSLMTLGAYIAAEHCSSLRGMSIKCWYLNTAHSKIISLLRKGREKSEERRESDIFFLDVDQYVTAYNYRLRDSDGSKNYRGRFLQEDWMAFAVRLGKHPEEIKLLKQILSTRKEKKIEKTIELLKFLQELEASGLVRDVREEDAYILFSLSEEQHKFLNGAWLELYVYQEAQKLNFFDNIQWSKEIIDNDPKRTVTFPLSFKEIDVALTYKAHFLIVECKTADELSSGMLDGIVAIANLIGRTAVINILVTSVSLSQHKDKNQLTAHDDFKTKAKTKGVYVIMLDDLPHIGEKLKEITKLAMKKMR